MPIITTASNQHNRLQPEGYQCTQLSRGGDLRVPRAPATTTLPNCTSAAVVVSSRWAAMMLGDGADTILLGGQYNHTEDAPIDGYQCTQLSHGGDLHVSRPPATISLPNHTPLSLLCAAVGRWY